MPSLKDWFSSHHATIKQRGDKQKGKTATVAAGFKTISANFRAAKKMSKATTEEEKDAVQAELEEQNQSNLLGLLWTSTSIDITNTLNVATQMVLFDQSVNVETRKKRGFALRALGEIFEAAPTPEDGKTAQAAYEEAAQAAMVETLKRKDEVEKAATVETM
mmetsp:Transcript_22673/g.34662  ORF Transcript_22673/g.34662 Transcript_22673/m.34662 type:complete len:162 (+) Transcript_22673:1273-1758(+)